MTEKDLSEYQFAAVVPDYAVEDLLPSFSNGGIAYTPWVVGAKAAKDFDRLKEEAKKFKQIAELMVWAEQNGFVVLNSLHDHGLCVAEIAPDDEENEDFVLCEVCNHQVAFGGLWWPFCSETCFSCGYKDQPPAARTQE